MSRDYAISRVKDALEKSGGNHLKAHRLILSWLEKDQSLLLGLVAPHLNSLVTHAIAHVTSPPKKIKAEDYAGDAFSASLLEALSGRGVETGAFGEPPSGNVAKPGKTSKAHVDAINVLVKASKNKGGATGKGKK